MNYAFRKKIIYISFPFHNMVHYGDRSMEVFRVSARRQPNRPTDLRTNQPTNSRDGPTDMRMHREVTLTIKMVGGPVFAGHL